MSVDLRLLVGQVIGMFVVFGLALFVPAGTLLWIPGWVCILEFFVFTIALSVWLLNHNPGLLQERISGVGKADQKAWDKIFLVLTFFVFFGWLAVMAIDAGRLGWSHVPVWLQTVGSLVLLWSFWLFFTVFRENPYLSPAVRIQEERGQTVVSTGPYAYVRHPMYAALIPFCTGTTLLLGSWYGLLGGLLLVVLVAWRAVHEEQTLRDELSGYREYMERVRYRIIPFIW